VDGRACVLMERVQAEVARLWPGAMVSCFGSRATGLACASSDVDLVVMNVPGLAGSADCSMGAQLALLELLQPQLAQLPGVVSTAINKASVPIIALSAVLPGTATELHLDVSLHTEHHGGLQAAQHVRMLHTLLPVLQPLVLILKELLHRHSLKSAFTGGLSSYALVVLVSRFLLDRHALRYPCSVTPYPEGDGWRPEHGGPHSLASLLLECMHFLGSVFDPKRHAVRHPRPSPRSGHVLPGKHVLEFGFVHREHRDLEQFAMHPLLCADPIRLDNNIGKTCYRIHQIQALFAATAARLKAAAGEATGATDEAPESLEGHIFEAVFGGTA